MLKIVYLNRFFFVLPLFFTMVSCGVSKSLKDIPNIEQYVAESPKRIKINDSTYTSNNGFISKNNQGLWELYVQGNPLEIGLTTGSLTQELFHKQEDALLSKVGEMVPSKTKQFFLRKFLAWFNRKMYLNIKEEFKTEIYGLSKYASHDYDYIAEPYRRVLYLHGAHEIYNNVSEIL